MTTQPTVRRPRGISILGALQAAAGGIGLAAGASGFVAASTGAHILGPMAPYVPAIGAALMFFGAVSLVMSVGLLRGLAWAWAITLAAEALHGLGDLGSMAARGFEPNKLIGLAFAAALVYYLTRPGVRAYFGRN